MTPKLIKFPPSLLLKLKAKADAKGVSVSHVIRWACEEYVKRKERGE